MLPAACKKVKSKMLKNQNLNKTTYKNKEILNICENKVASLNRYLYFHPETPYRIAVIGNASIAEYISTHTGFPILILLLKNC